MAEEISSNIIVVQMAPESTPGLVPGSGFVDILASEGSTIDYSADEISRDVLQPHFSAKSFVPGAAVFDIKLTLEYKGGGYDSGLVVPEMDLPIRSSGCVRKDGLIITHAAPSGGVFAVGEAITNNDAAGATVGRVYEVDGNVARIYQEAGNNDPAAAEVITNGTATAAVSGTPKTSFVYKPISERSAMLTCSLRFYHDGILYEAPYVRGTCKIDTAVNNYGKVEYSAMGVYAAPTDTPVPSSSPLDIDPPRMVGVDLQIGAIDFTDIAIENFGIDLGVTNNKRLDMKASGGVKGVKFGGREITGSFDPDKTLLAEHDPNAIFFNRTLQKITQHVGTESGNILRQTINKAQYRKRTVSDRQGTQAYSIPFLCTGNTLGDDEWFLTIEEA